MTTQPEIGFAGVNAAANRSSQEAVRSFPHTNDSARAVQWNGDNFDVGGKSVRLLAYAVAPFRTRKTSRIFGWLMAVEKALRRFVYLPFGIRCIVTCRKPQAGQKYVERRRGV